MSSVRRKGLVWLSVNLYACDRARQVVARSSKVVKVVVSSVAWSTIYCFMGIKCLERKRDGDQPVRSRIRRQCEVLPRFGQQGLLFPSSAACLETRSRWTMSSTQNKAKASNLTPELVAVWFPLSEGVAAPAETRLTCMWTGQARLLLSVKPSPGWASTPETHSLEEKGGDMMLLTCCIECCKSGWRIIGKSGSIPAEKATDTS